jgi:hypothetical protein
MTMSSADRPQRNEPIFDIDPVTGRSIEVFYADRTLETFGRDGAGWFWWPRRRGFTPIGPACGPFPTNYSAYRNAMLGDGLGSNLGIGRTTTTGNNVKTEAYAVFVAEREGFSARVPGTSKTAIKSASPDNRGGLCVPMACTGPADAAQADSAGW